METLADRIRTVVDLYWDGSVNAAAAAMGITQQTLQRVVSGRTLNPRVSVLEAVAKASFCSVDWLLTGQGREPKESDAMGRRLSPGIGRWLRAVRDVFPGGGLVAAALQELPYAPKLLQEVCQGRFGKKRRVVQQNEDLEALVDAGAMIWAEVLEGVTVDLGAEAVRTQLEAREDLVLMGFSHWSLLLVLGAESKRRIEAMKSVMAADEDMTTLQLSQLLSAKLGPQDS